MEDIVGVIDGRASLADEVQSSPPELRSSLAQDITELLAEPRFLDALPGYLLPDDANQARIPQLYRKLERLTDIG